MIAVTFALPAESSDFIRLLKRKSRVGAAIRGTIRAQEVVVSHTTVGERSARGRVCEFLANHKPQLLVSSGFAGALTDQLQVGDVLLADNYSDPVHLARARASLPPSNTRVGLLVTAASVVDSTAARAELARNSQAVAVDMESRCIAEACRAHEVPMLSIRAISDTPAAPLPVPADLMFDLERQRTPFAALAIHVARDPGALWRLACFTRQIQIARRSLADALEAVLRSA